MSGECDDCGEHTTDCTCNERRRDAEHLSPTAMRDKCDRILGLISCLQMIIEDCDYKAWTKKPHLDLIFSIEDEIKVLEKNLRYV